VSHPRKQAVPTRLGAGDAGILQCIANRLEVRHWLPEVLLTLTASCMPLLPAHATQVLDDSVGLITGSQIFSDTFAVTTPGVLTVNLAPIAWLDTVQDLNCFLTSPSGGLIGPAFNGTSETSQIQAGDITVNWYGVAAGTYGVGAYSINVDFAPSVPPPPVPLPASLPLLLCGLGVLAVARCKRRSLPLAC
jgi:hypothetical protein